MVDGLLESVPFVTVAFFLSWATNLDKNPEFSKPDFKKFIPPVDQQSLKRFSREDFLPNAGRKTLFREKTFVFFSTQQYQSIASTIKRAGGRALMDSERPHEDEDILVESNSQKTAEFRLRQEKVKAQGKVFPLLFLAKKGEYVKNDHFFFHFRGLLD